jgi:calcium-dependent phosphoinositide phospholipase C
LFARSSGFLTILVGLALSAPACSGDDATAQDAGCATGACPEAGGDGETTSDASDSVDSGSGSDGGTSPEAGPGSDVARDQGNAIDGGGAPDAPADGVRPIDGNADTARPADAMSDAGPIVDAAPDVVVAPDARPDGGGGGSVDAGDLDEILHFNDIQMEGTHNSYHVETTGGIIPAWAYTHKALDVQLTMQGVRQFELDIHYAGPTDWPVHHVPPDVGTTCAALAECLGLLKTWSDAHPRHAPLVVLLEQKDEYDGMKISGHYDELDAMLLSVWPRERIITPDEVRGQRATLREAVTTDGWPTLGKTRGRILFAFIGDSTEYMNGHPNLENRVVFPRANVSDPFAAFVLMDNAQGSEAQITDAVRQGFIVRTRYNGEELKLVPEVLEAAQRGGAHCLSGDFPADFALTGGAPSRCNPVRAPAGCTAAAVEQL